MNGRSVRAATALLTAGSVLGACAGPSGSIDQQLRAWAGGAGWPASARSLHGDLARLSELTTDTPGARRTVCDVLVTDALAANDELPTPDSKLTTLLAQSYSDAAAAGRACFSGPGGIAAAQSRGRRAGSTLVRAEARYDALTSALSSP